MDEEKRKNYLYLYKLRCYMSQQVPAEAELLQPHYAFVLEKSKGITMISKSVRLARRRRPLPPAAPRRPPTPTRRHRFLRRTAC